jgi:hypothetical protein
VVASWAGEERFALFASLRLCVEKSIGTAAEVSGVSFDSSV